MKRFQIGPTKLRNGWEARIYALDGGGDYPIHGACLKPGGEWAARVFGSDGKMYADNDAYDLLPNAAPVVSDAALDAFYKARGGARACQRDAYDAKIAAGIAAAFAVMLAEQERGK